MKFSGKVKLKAKRTQAEISEFPSRISWDFPIEIFMWPHYVYIMDSEIYQAGANCQMPKSKAKRKILAVFMESPLYFTIPLQRRLEFLKFFSQQSVYKRIFEHNPHLMGPKADTKPPDQGEKEAP